MPRARIPVVAVAAIAVLAVLGMALVFGAFDNPRDRGGNRVLIVTTFPGLGDDIMILAGECNVTVEEIVSGDPHTAQLSPAQVRILMDADIVVTMGHTPADLKAREVAEGIVIDVPSIDGIMLLTLPGDGINMHYPIYDPGNYLVFQRELASALEQAGCIPDASSMGQVEKLISDYSGIYTGVIGVADEPFVQYAVSWLGVELRLVLNPGEHSQASGVMLEEASALLEQGAVAFITVDDEGRPVSAHGEWLLDKASSIGAPVVMVPAPYANGTVPEMLEYIISQLRG